jgi:hypothetical protein
MKHVMILVMNKYWFCAQQGTTSEAFGDSKKDDRADPSLGVAAGQDHVATIEQSPLSSIR